MYFILWRHLKKEEEKKNISFLHILIQRMFSYLFWKLFMNPVFLLS